MVPGRSFLLLNGLFFLFLGTRTVLTRTIGNEDDSDLLEEPFKLEETYTVDFLPFHFNGSWKSETTILYTYGLTGDVLEFDVNTQTSKVIVDASELRSSYFHKIYEFAQFTLSPSGRFLLIGYDAKKVYRHSRLMKYVIYNIQQRKYDSIENGAYLSLARWAPLSDDLLYIRDNDIYYRRFLRNAQRVTNNGVDGVIYNGIPDWVYEEEVLHDASAVWFSPDGSRLVYATFDDTNVKDISYSHYGEPGSLKDQYPTEIKLKYPKPGTPNPVVSLTLVYLNDPTLPKIDLKAPIDAVGSDNVMFNVAWDNLNEIVATWMNRVQNRARVVWYNLKGEIVKALDLVEEEGWLDVKKLAFHEGSVFLRKLQPSGTPAGRFHHVTRYDDLNEERPTETDLTPGPSEVEVILGIDNANNRIYYLGSAPGQPSHRNLYSVPVDGSEEPTCISCEVLTPEGNRCSYADVVFSPLKSHYVLTCYGPDPAFVNIFNSEHQRVYQWEDNLSVRRRLAGRILPSVKNLSVRVNGYECRVRLVLPYEFDETKSYPMLVNVYAGPNTAQISEIFRVDYSMYMATNRSVIYAFIDGRGSSNMGSKMLFEIYRKIGTVEVDDQISVTRYLQNTYPWIDSKRTGIWGWSYGGFAAAMVLAKDTASTFKCAVSVAPVSSWIYYDSIYTERFMGLPTEEDNLRGYNETDVTRRIEGIRGKKYLLVHGTGDDNVHYQQSLALAKALEVADILFQQITYTDEAHALFGVLPHLYHTMDRFWSECFNLPQIY